MIDKTHSEHNESGFSLIADMRADIDFWRSVPRGDAEAIASRA
jgi:hypothetical protein